MAPYSVRSEGLFCEQLGSNRLWLWFLDRQFRPGTFNPSVFAKNSERVLSAEVVRLFLAEIDPLLRQHGWTSDEPFTADGMRIELWTSRKSLVRKDGRDAQKRQPARRRILGI